MLLRPLLCVQPYIFFIHIIKEGREKKNDDYTSPFSFFPFSCRSNLFKPQKQKRIEGAPCFLFYDDPAIRFLV